MSPNEYKIRAKRLSKRDIQLLRTEDSLVIKDCDIDFLIVLACIVGAPILMVFF